MKKTLSLIVLILMLAVGFTACQGNTNNEGNLDSSSKENTQQDGEESFESVTLTDKSGEKVTIDEKPERIVSVVPSATEIVYAVGAGDRVVGVSDHANYPEEVQEVEKVGGMQLNIEKIVSMNPDLVVADQLNGESIKALRQAGLKVLVLGAQNLNAVYEDIELVGKATGNVDQAEEIISNMKSDVSLVQEKVSSLSADEKKRVWIEVGPELFSGGEGSFINEMIELAGGINIIGDQEGWPQVSEEVVIQENPDVIVTTYGYYVDQAVEKVLGRKGWQDVNAIKNEQVYDLHSDLLTRPGPRLTEGLKTLAEKLYPNLFN